MLCGEALKRIYRSAVILTDIVWYMLLGTRRCKERQGLTTQLREELCRSKPFCPLNLNLSNTEDAVATLCHLLHSHSTHLLGILGHIELYIAHNLHTITLNICKTHRYPLLGKRQHTARLDSAACTAALNTLRKPMVIVAIYLHTGLDAVEAVRLNDIALNLIDICADDTVTCDKAKTITRT